MQLLLPITVQLLFALSCVVIGVMIGYTMICKKRIRWLALFIAVLGLIPIVLHCIFVNINLTLITTISYLVISIPMLLSIKKYFKKKSDQNQQN
jgi:hypothetical protein